MVRICIFFLYLSFLEITALCKKQILVYKTSGKVPPMPDKGREHPPLKMFNCRWSHRAPGKCSKWNKYKSLVGKHNKNKRIVWNTSLWECFWVTWQANLPTSPQSMEIEDYLYQRIRLHIPSLLLEQWEYEIFNQEFNLVEGSRRMTPTRI